jgi:hypothetical protein
MMNKLMTWVLGIGLAMPLIGAMAGCTMVEDPQEHYRRLSRNFDLETRELVEDLDTLTMYDEPSHLTPYYMPHKPH